MNMRAKFQVVSVTPSGPEYQPPFEDIVFNAVSGKFGPDGESEDNEFARWTPTAELRIRITNPALHGKFTVGEKHYADFSPAAE